MKEYLYDVLKCGDFPLGLDIGNGILFTVMPAVENSGTVSWTLYNPETKNTGTLEVLRYFVNAMSFGDFCGLIALLENRISRLDLKSASF